MGYLDNSAITVDAILTKKGRELLSAGKFEITQFALSDDEINYSLWNPAHPQGSDYYGIIIENTPITEAVPDETRSLRHKLVTLGRRTTRIPQVTATPTSIDIYDDAQSVIRMSTVDGGNSSLGYTATLLNSDAASITGNSGVPGNQTDEVSPSDHVRSTTVTLKDMLYIRPKTLISTGETITTKIIIIGNETGGRVEVDFVVRPRRR